MYNQMRDRDRAGSYQRDEGGYEHDEYDEYEVEASEPEEEEEEEDPKLMKEEQEFLNARERIKEKIREKMKKQSSNSFGHLNESQDKKRIVTNDKFGSFFGSSKPVIAPRVLEERRSIRETQHIVAKVPSSSSIQNKRDNVSTLTELKTRADNQQQRVVKEVKNKAQTLKNMRDYSFLLSDDADLPATKEQPAPKKISVPNFGNAVRPAPVKERPVPPITRKYPVSNSDGRLVQATLKSNIPASKPAKFVSNGHVKNSASTSQHTQFKVGTKEPPMSKPKPALVESRKGISIGSGNRSNQPVGHKVLPRKVSAQATDSSKAPAKVMNGHGMNKKPSSAKPHSSIQNHHSEQRRMIQGSDKVKITPKQPLPSSKVQPMKPAKQISSRGIPEDRPKKRPIRRDEEDDANDAIQMIRNMFGYNPSRYAGVDDQDDSDMEVGFDRIMKEELRSAKIARQEDEEELRLIEEEERRERMRKKQKMSRR